MTPILSTPTKLLSPRFAVSTLLTTALLCFGCLFVLDSRATTETESHQSAPLPEGYVGEKQCAPCHREIYDTFKKLGMGQSWLDPATAPIIEDYETKNTFQHAKSGFIYKMLHKDGKFIQEYDDFGRISGLAIGKDDVIYTADSESTERSHPGWLKGIRVGSVQDGKVTVFIPPHKTDAPDGAMGEGIAIDAAGNIYTAEATLRGVTKYVKN